MININTDLKIQDIQTQLTQLWQLSAEKISTLEQRWNSKDGSPVFTIAGKYTSQGWTEWTQGFQFGSSLLQYDATGEQTFLDQGRRNTVDFMAPHITHFGVHDHGFNNVSTYGNLLRLMAENRIPYNKTEKDFYELALKCSGAVQARRWTKIAGGGGFIHSFNGPHSLFADTIRSLRSLALGHKLGHWLLEERDNRVSLLERLIQHAQSTAQYSVYYGEGRDRYDMRGRVVHESIFNVADGNYRCPSSQQGYSPFTTWTRGLSWILCGYPEQLEFLEIVSDDDLEPFGGRSTVEDMMLKAALAAADFYIDQSPTDGIPYWDTGAPELHKLGDYLNKPADPYNAYEPVDSSAAAISCQGLMRLGKYLSGRNDTRGVSYFQAGLTVLQNLLSEPYISVDRNHEGLLLHSIYHQPNGWDYVPEGSSVANGESSMWGDYHLREAALYVKRLQDGESYYTFFGQSANQ